MLFFTTVHLTQQRARLQQNIQQRCQQISNCSFNATIASTQRKNSQKTEDICFFTHLKYGAKNNPDLLWGPGREEEGIFIDCGHLCT